MQNSVKHNKISRREFLTGMAGAGAVAFGGAALAACAAQPTPTPVPPTAVPPTAVPPTAVPPTAVPAAPVVVTKPKITVWLQNALLTEIDQMQEARFKEWGARSNVEVEFLAVPQGTFYQRLSAAFEAGTPPDIFHNMVSNLQVYRARGLLAPMDDVVAKMQNKWGGVLDAPLAIVGGDGGYWGMPYALTQIVMHTRQDLLDKAGLKYPATWDELLETAKALQEPPGLYGFAAPLGPMNDTDTTFLPILWGYGGKYENDDGSLAFKSDAMLKAINYIGKAFRDYKVIPAAAVGWDGTGNNLAYQSRQAVFCYNSTSIYAWCEANDPELAQATTLHGAPAGPVGAFDDIDGWGLCIPSSSPHIAEAKAALEDLFITSDYYRTFIESAKNRYLPVYKELLHSDFFAKHPVYGPPAQMAEQARLMCYSGPFHAAVGELLTTAVVPEMLQKVCIQGMAAEQAMEEGYAKAKAIWEKNNL